MFPIIQIGPFAVQAPLLLMLLGLWFSLSVGARYAAVFGVKSRLLDDLVLYSVFLGLVGGRLFYVVRFPGAFLENPASILSLNPELFMASGGLLVGGIAFLVILQRRKEPLWQTLDALALPAAIFAIFLGISHLASGQVYGLPSSLPWAVDLWGTSRHPTQVYEILAAALIASVLWKRLSTRDSVVTSHPSAPGQYFLSFTVLTALAWIFIETFRGDAAILLGNLRLVQLAAFLVLVLSFYAMGQGQRKAGTNQQHMKGVHDA